MFSRTLRSVKSAPNLRQRAISVNPPPIPQMRVSYLHNSAHSTKPSNLLTTTSKYMSLSVSALRAECRKKGIKVGGRKAELVDRLMSLDASKQVNVKHISTTKPKSTKGDASSIDFYKVPHPKPEVYKPAFKIPVPPDAHGTSAKVIPDPEYISSVPDHGVGDHIEGKVSGTKDASKVHLPGSNEPSIGEHDSPIGSSSGGEEGSGSSEFSGKDRTFLGGFAIGLVGWWLLPFGGKKEKK